MASRKTRYKWGNESPAARARELESKIHTRVDEFGSRLVDAVRLAMVSLGLETGTIRDRRGALEPVIEACFERADALGHERFEDKLLLAEVLEKVVQLAAVLGLDFRTINLSDDRERALIEQLILGILDVRRQRGDRAIAVEAFIQGARGAGSQPGEIDAAIGAMTGDFPAPDSPA